MFQSCATAGTGPSMKVLCGTGRWTAQSVAAQEQPCEEGPLRRTDMENTQLGDQRLMEQAWWTWDSVARSLAEQRLQEGNACSRVGTQPRTQTLRNSGTNDRSKPTMLSHHFIYLQITHYVLWVCTLGCVSNPACLPHFCPS